MAIPAKIVTEGAAGGRTMPVAELHRRPGSTPHIETVLRPGELILAIEVPAGPHTRRSHYLKIRDRQSFAFALGSLRWEIRAKAVVALFVRDHAFTYRAGWSFDSCYELTASRAIERQGVRERATSAKRDCLLGPNVAYGTACAQHVLSHRCLEPTCDGVTRRARAKGCAACPCPGVY